MKTMPHGPRHSSGVALYFVSDAYDPGRHGLNGRRVAGQSFLTGYLRHMGEGPLTLCVDTAQAARAAREFCETVSPGRELRIVPTYSPQMTGIGTMYYPALTIADRAWARMPRGQSAWSLCGITHTTATRGSMAQIAQLGVAPLEPWDAVICTSRAVQSGVQTQLALTEEYLARRMPGGAPPPRPITEVIPLGIDTAAFAPDPSEGAKLRQKLGIAEGDVLCMVLSRLVPWGKFDPIPLYLSLQKAAQMTGKRLHLALVGRLDVGARERDFTDPARLMPDVTLHILDGADAAVRKASFSGADMFLFPIDNLQETFGLAPIEAMAAGLPVIATDWDGLRDTVSPESGFLIPTVTGDADHSRVESVRYLIGTDTELHFQGLAASMTSYDTGAMATRIAQLANDDDLRRRMGRAAQAHAISTFDWAQVIPQMQDLWARQNDLRAAVSREDSARYARLEVPVLPSAFATFAAWPSQRIKAGMLRVAATPAEGRAGIDEILTLRRHHEFKRGLETDERFHKVLAALRAAPGPLTSGQLAKSLNLPVLAIERVVLWLVKYDLATLA
ncbi:glycosyl transferase family 1 [Paracoccus sulfuroxidans]|uniref:Glycosyl transferase family 1 n=2 Tax=Paracoccus sulfuroxidans TaxID=384678 RepID=A0A562P0L7_9RHOB|nr:glycosyl transferase family 1 [Paracoccus sulfuroxidans]